MNPPTPHSRPSGYVTQTRRLTILDTSEPHAFATPTKRIHEGHHVPAFLTSRGYGDIALFVMQLNIAMCPRKVPGTNDVQSWQLGSPISLTEPVLKLQKLLESICAIVEEAPPQTGPRRFGNVSFRKWHEILESKIQDLLQSHLPPEIVNYSSVGGVSALDELTPYLLGAFGSSQRLDYGTGHELSFLAFLGCIWKLGGFTKEYPENGSLERSIVLGVIEPYLQVIRSLILTYTLEPAGSHGVWGLDDHSFLPYILGSSQYCPAITEEDPMPLENSLPNSPNPGDVAKKSIVDRERKHNMYFSAIGFINDVKTGAFWEHSPILFDISGVRAGWGKINKGMIKMYHAEVLSKFPVVQHFPFGSLFSWDQDPSADTPGASAHTANQPTKAPQPQETTKVNWTNPSSGAGMPSMTAPSGSRVPPSGMSVTRAPWTNATSQASEGQVGNHEGIPPPGKFDRATKAPWAKDNSGR